MINYLDTTALHQDAGELLSGRDRYGHRGAGARRRRAQVNRRKVTTHGGRVVTSVEEVTLPELPIVVAA